MVLVVICTVARGQEKPGKETDTIRIGNIIITRDGNKTTDNDDDKGRTRINLGRKYHRKLSKVSTNWGIVDLGISNYSDETD